MVEDIDFLLNILNQVSILRYFTMTHPFSYLNYGTIKITMKFIWSIIIKIKTKGNSKKMSRRLKHFCELCRKQCKD